MYYIQTAEDIVKLLSPPSSAIILVFWLRAPILNSQGTPSARTQNTRGWKNFAIFDWNRRLSRKRYETVSRRSWGKTLFIDWILLYLSIKLCWIQVKLEGCIDDERQFKTAKRSQAPGDATVLKRSFNDNFGTFRHRSKWIALSNQWIFLRVSICKFSIFVLVTWPLFGTFQWPISAKRLDSPD